MFRHKCDVYFSNADAMPRGEDDVIEVDEMGPPSSAQHWLWGTSDAHCSPYGFLQHLVPADTCALPVPVIPSCCSR